MTRLLLAPGAVRDIERSTDFSISNDEASASATAGILIEGLAIQQHALVGRTVAFALRELAISRGRSGYVAFIATMWSSIPLLFAPYAISETGL